MLFRWFHFWTAAIDFPVASATGCTPRVAITSACEFMENKYGQFV